MSIDFVSFRSQPYRCSATETSGWITVAAATVALLVGWWPRRWQSSNAVSPVSDLSLADAVPASHSVSALLMRASNGWNLRDCFISGELSE
jgi:hypothetical protein